MASCSSADKDNGPDKKKSRMMGEPIDGQVTPGCQFVKQETIASAKWLSLTKITYKDPIGRERTWEAVSRTTKKGNVADGVAVLSILKRSLKYDCVICIKQYRPPLKAYTIEFPAGLIDAGETPEEAARRELKEETGYVSKIKHCSPATCLDSGTEDCTLIIVTAEIDGDDPVNKKPEQELEESEFIEVLKIPLDELLPRLNAYAEDGVVVDARVYSYAIASTQAHKERPLEPDLK